MAAKSMRTDCRTGWRGASAVRNGPTQRLEPAATSSSTVEEWLIIPSHDGGSARCRRATGLTARTLRYYEELGLLIPAERLASGHRVYASDDLRRLYRDLAAQAAGPATVRTSPANWTIPRATCADTLDRHIGQVDQRLAALGRHRERMITVRDSLAAGSPTDEELLDILQEMAEIDHGLTQRLTLLGLQRHRSCT